LTEEKLTRHPYNLPGGPAANLYLEIEKIKSSSIQVKLKSDFLVYPLPHTFMNKYIERKEFGMIIDFINKQLELSSTDIRNLSFIIVEGLSGVGKTQFCYEVIRYFLKNSKIPVLYNLINLFKYSHVDDTTKTMEYGLNFLIEDFIKQHTTLQPDNIKNIHLPKDEILQKLVKELWKDYKYDPNLNKTIQNVWFIMIDEFQVNPSITKAILRAISLWNNDFLKMKSDYNNNNNKLNFYQPKLNILIIPLLSGTSSHGIDIKELIKVTNYSAHKISLSLMVEYEKKIFKSLLNSLNLKKNEYIKLLLYYCNGWFMAYQKIYEDVKRKNISVEISLEDCKDIFKSIVAFLKDKYTNPEIWLKNFGSSEDGIKKILFLAASGHKVPLSEPINGSDLIKLSENGLFSLNKVEDSGKVRVEIPFIIFCLINSFDEFKICDFNIFSPFNTYWKFTEKLVISTLQLNLLSFVYQNKKIIKYKDIRPNIQYSSNLENLEIVIPPINNIKIYQLKKQIICIKSQGKEKGTFNYEKFDISNIIINRNQPLNIKEGGILKATENQPLFEFLTILPSNDSNIKSCFIFTQVKHKNFINETTGTETKYSKLNISNIKKESKIIMENAIKSGIDNKNNNIIIEYISARPLSNRKFKDEIKNIKDTYISIADEKSFISCLGPLFGKVYSKLLETLRKQQNF
jgi:hypothetical protein